MTHVDACGSELRRLFDESQNNPNLSFVVTPSSDERYRQFQALYGVCCTNVDVDATPVCLVENAVPTDDPPEQDRTERSKSKKALMIPLVSVVAVCVGALCQRFNLKKKKKHI
jgi:hypothetical protein